MSVAEHRPVATLVVDARKKLGLTQRELGELLHTHRNSVARWESGVVVPSLRNLLLLKAHVSDPGFLARIGAVIESAIHADHQRERPIHNPSIPASEGGGNVRN